jgi:Lar family restriction alleviation protein
MSEELKPCPFCGGKAMFLTITNKSSHLAVGVMFKIKCMKCGTELPKSYECEMYMDQGGGIRTGKDERTKATTDWNRRANDGKIDADKLKADLEKAISKNEDMDCLDFLRVASFIDAQPTAYDPDKVVEQLEKLKSLVPVNRVLDDIINDKPKELGMLIAYEKAIEIVKGGGVDG